MQEFLLAKAKKNLSCNGALRAPVQGFIYTDTGCNRHEVPIVADLLVCVAQWYDRMLIRYRTTPAPLANRNPTQFFAASSGMQSGSPPRTLHKLQP